MTDRKAFLRDLTDAQINILLHLLVEDIRSQSGLDPWSMGASGTVPDWIGRIGKFYERIKQGDYWKAERDAFERGEYKPAES